MTWKLIAELDCSNPIINSDHTKIYKEEDTLNSKRVRTIDRLQYKIPVTKPSLNDKGPIAQGVSLLEFNYDDNFLACKNGTLCPKFRQYALYGLDLERIYSWSGDDNILEQPYKNDEMAQIGQQFMYHMRHWQGIVLERWCDLRMQFPDGELSVQGAEVCMEQWLQTDAAFR